MTKASKLMPGDTVGIISPSWGGAGAFPHRVELGIRHLRSLGMDFGHTLPKFTLPIGCRTRVDTVARR